MEFIEELAKLAEVIEERKSMVQTEEATKMSFIAPFLRLLGYDVFNPSVVIPEFSADIANRKGEKVDYAIMKDGKPLILVEAKNYTENLDNHDNQLIRYFNVTEAKFAILTNGIEYRFFSDLEEPNKMDKKPFLIINMDKLIDRKVKQLEQFKFDTLNIDSILSMASDQKYHSEIRAIFKREIENPSDEFVKFFGKKITDRVMTANVVDEFRLHIKKAFSNMVDDLANEKINSIQAKIKQNQLDTNSTEKEEQEDGIVTTEEELQSFYIVRSIIASSPDIQSSDVCYKDTISYFSVYLYGKITRWVCRFYYRQNVNYLVIPCENGEEKRYDIKVPDDIYSLSKELLEAANFRKNK